MLWAWKVPTAECIPDTARASLRAGFTHHTDGARAANRSPITAILSAGLGSSVKCRDSLVVCHPPSSLRGRNQARIFWKGTLTRTGMRNLPEPPPPVTRRHRRGRTAARLPAVLARQNPAVRSPCLRPMHPPVCKGSRQLPFLCLQFRCEKFSFQPRATSDLFCISKIPS